MDPVFNPMGERKSAFPNFPKNLEAQDQKQKWPEWCGKTFYKLNKIGSYDINTIVNA